MTDEQEAVISAVHHQLAHGEASEGDLKDIHWCAEQLRELLGAPPPFKPRKFLPDHPAIDRIGPAVKPGETPQMTIVKAQDFKDLAVLVDHVVDLLDHTIQPEKKT